MLVIGGVALVLRVCNLGTFSLWLDEVFTMTVASLPLADTLAACAADAENVPMYAVIANLGLRIGLNEPWIRLLPVAAGVASIALLAVWTRRHFDRGTALATAAFCALSTFHIRYSQELRAYPFLLLMCTLTLLAADRVRSRPGWKSTAALALTVAAGCYTNLTYVLVLVPVTGLIAAGGPADPSGDRAARRRVWRHSATGVALGLLAFAPWVWRIWPALTTRLARPRTSDWNLEFLGMHWQGLTIAQGHYERVTWFGLVLAVFFVIGIAEALGRRVGRAVLLPAVATLVAWEIVLVAIRHWTTSRYDTALWPFLAVLIALGFVRVLRLLRWRPLQWAAAAATAAMLLVHADAYLRNGRPHWNLVADAVRQLRLPGEPVVALEHFDRTCLSYYLGEDIPTINQQAQRLHGWLEGSPSLLLVAGRRLEPEFTGPADVHAMLVVVHRTAEIHRLRRVPGAESGTIAVGADGRPRSWPSPVAEPVAGAFEEPPSGCLARFTGWRGRPAQVPVTRIEFDPRDTGHLRSGWDRPRSRPDGTTLAWIVGPEASLELRLAEPAPGRLAVRLRSHPEIERGQWVRVLFNGRAVAEQPLSRSLQDVGADVPAELWRDGRGLLVLQLARVRDVPGVRPRSAEVDWIAWSPAAGAP